MCTSRIPPSTYVGTTRTGQELIDLVRALHTDGLDALTRDVNIKDPTALRALLKAAVVVLDTERTFRPRSKIRRSLRR